jgi:hypothetical protein
MSGDCAIPSRARHNKDAAHTLAGFTFKKGSVPFTWRAETLWLLAGLAKLLDIRTFYYHLKEDCQADMGQVKAVKRTLGKAKSTPSRNNSHCSALGPLLREMHRMGYNGIGVRPVLSPVLSLSKCCRRDRAQAGRSGVWEFGSFAGCGGGGVGGGWGEEKYGRAGCRVISRLIDETRLA